MTELQPCRTAGAEDPAHGDLPRGLPAWTYFNNELTDAGIRADDPPVLAVRLPCESAEERPAISPRST